MNTEKIPITLITGFLGSGKTTLINKIIEKEANKKIVVIENEFSDLPIDAEIISGISNNLVFELANGCICCTLDNELRETLLQLLKMKLNFDHVLIETTGIAEPDIIVQNLIASEELKECFYIDSICCLVDAMNFESNLKEKESIKQLSVADLVLINKIETSKKEQAEYISSKIRTYNSVCEIITTNFCDYGNTKIIDKLFFNEADFSKVFDNIKLNEQNKVHQQQHEIKTMSFLLDGSFDRKKFSRWMDYFLHINQNSIIRLKGILCFKGISRKMILQAIKSSYTLVEGNFWKYGEKRHSKIIFIGRNLNKENIYVGIESLISEAD